MGEKSQIVKINVGGKSYYTKLQTLVKSVYFETLFNGTMQNLIYTGRNNDEVFIDRSGEVFRHVLQYLRTGILFSTEVNTLKKLNIEAKYYGIVKLIDAVDEKLEYLSKNEDAYMFINSDKLVDKYMVNPKSSTVIKEDNEEFKLLQVVQSFETIETHERCYLEHTEQNKDSKNCAHENKKRIDIPVRRVIVRKYVAE